MQAGRPGRPGAGAGDGKGQLQELKKEAGAGPENEKGHGVTRLVFDTFLCPAKLDALSIFSIWPSFVSVVSFSQTTSILHFKLSPLYIECIDLNPSFHLSFSPLFQDTQRDCPPWVLYHCIRSMESKWKLCFFSHHLVTVLCVPQPVVPREKCVWLLSFIFQTPLASKHTLPTTFSSPSLSFCPIAVALDQANVSIFLEGFSSY